MRTRRVMTFFLLLTLVSCRVNYSFTGASISPDVKTITIDYFQNKSTLVVPTLSRDLTEGLRDYFTSQTSLALQERGGDLVLEGTITSYEPGKPIAHNRQPHHTYPLYHFAVCLSTHPLTARADAFGSAL